MVPRKSLDDTISIIATLLHDIQTSHGAVFNCRSEKLTLKKIVSRVQCEGIGFLTKALPRYAKALDKALSGGAQFNAAALGFKPIRAGSNLPMLFGELMSCVLSHNGELLPNPCAISVRSLRQLLCCFSKHKLPYEDKDCEKVIKQFEKTEDDLTTTTMDLRKLRSIVDSRKPVHIHGAPHGVPRRGTTHKRGPTLASYYHLLSRRGVRCDMDGYPRLRRRDKCRIPSSRFGRKRGPKPSFFFLRDSVYSEQNRCMPYGMHFQSRRAFPNLFGRTYHGCLVDVTCTARLLLKRLFAAFDPKDIYPCHGPGAVATRQELWEKFQWSNISANITKVYHLDQYFCASLGHVCDTYDKYKLIKDESLPARVILVPKDSRGPRLISAEPVDYQWVQQGLGTAIVTHVENHILTREHVFFTNQRTNQIGALLGSSTGKYATLDLKEASDRVSVELVRLLFPPQIVECLEACRSLSTVLPDGRELKLQKFAPMGSSLCFPIMALTIWAILAAGAPDTYTRDRIAVYGDDVIVTTAYAANAIEQLESFGLLINRDKSCTGGLFRESCGTDAFNGVDVTPVRIKTVWSSIRRPDVYTSYIEYANALYDRHYFTTYDEIVRRLHHIYGAIPDKDMRLSCPSLRVVTDDKKMLRSRVNHDEQKLEWNVWDVHTPLIKKEINGWDMLLRFFSEGGSQAVESLDGKWSRPSYEGSEIQKLINANVGARPFSVREYTRRRASMLVRRWR